MPDHTVGAPGTTRAAIEPDREERYEPFPLTPVQLAYWLGRTADFELGNVGAHGYGEVDFGAALVEQVGDNFEEALNRVIERHEMLRTIILPDGTQQTLPEVPHYEIQTEDLSQSPQETVTRRAEEIREELSHQQFDPGRWPLFDMRVTFLPEGARVHFSVDLLVVDFSSLQIMLRELFLLCLNPSAELPPLGITFREYVLAEIAQRDEERIARSREYWVERLDDLPPAPQLPFAVPPSSIREPRFHRRDHELPEADYERLKERATAIGVTPSVVLMTAFASVLATWARHSRLTLNLTLFNRLPVHPHVHGLVGDFTSLTLVAIENARSGSFAEQARAVQGQLWRDLEHREFSALDVMRELARHHGMAHAALMPVVFTSAIVKRYVSTGGLPIFWNYAISQTPQVWLDHQIFDREGGLYYAWDSVDALFPPDLLDEMFAAYRSLLEWMVDEDQTWDEPMPLLVPATHRERVATINATTADLPKGLLASGFWRNVADRPDAPAVAFGGTTVTYEQVAERVRRVVSALRRRGVEPGRLVGLVTERGVEQVVGALGIVSAGAAYLPIDPRLPPERVRHLLADGEVEVAVTQSAVDDQLEWPDGVERLRVDALEAADGPPDQVEVDEDELAYVIYTSGSTGAPKGVMIDHAGAVNTLEDVNRRFSIDADDRVLAVSSMSFDLSVYDVFGMLAAGGTVVVPEPAAARDPARWSELVEHHGVTVWNSVPALMELLVDRAERTGDGGFLRSLRLVLLSGDWIPVGLPDRLRAFAPEVQIVSLGGATEASIWSILHPIEDVDPGLSSIPYGRPMANQQVYVLDDEFDVRPVHVPGDIYIGGRGLAKGYWRDEEQTRSRFVTHPRSGRRLYRTGDLGRYLPDGTIEFLGREDAQVKVRGHRIELGEVEAALQRHPGVQSVAATAPSEDRPDRRRLVAHVVPGEGHSPTPDELRSFAADILPEHAVPSQIVLLDSLPLTSNGKVDRGALVRLVEPAPAAGGQADGSAEPSQELVDRMVAVVGSVVDRAGLEPDVDLSVMGIDSFDLMRLANVLEQEFGYRPGLDEIGMVTTIRSLAAYYAADGSRGATGAEGAAERAALSGDGTGPTPNLLLDDAERERFKSGELGAPRGVDGRAAVSLEPAELGEAARSAYLARQSVRSFSARPLALASLSALLGALRSARFDDERKYRYPSAGGAYPVHCFVQAKRDRIAGLAGGTYWYDRAAHRLVHLSDDAGDGGGVHWPANEPAFDSAAFSLFLATRLEDMTQLYGEVAKDFCLIEAGCMLQALMETAPALSIGLCSIGVVKVEHLRNALPLDDGMVLLNTILGGPDGGDGNGPGPRTSSESARPLTVGDGPLAALAPGGGSVDALRREIALAEEAFRARPGGLGIRATPAELEPRATLDFDVRPTSPRTGAPERVLLTGATGFVGRYMLRALLEQTDATVLCLMRSEERGIAEAALHSVLPASTDGSPLDASRVVPVLGDLSKPLLGLGERDFKRLASGVDAIYHTGADVNWVMPYDVLEPTNVGGTREILRLAAGSGSAPVHYASTVGIFGMKDREIREDSDIRDVPTVGGGYAQTKWVAERMIGRCAEAGLDARVLRIALALGDSRTGAFNPRSFADLMLAGCLELGAAPRLDARFNFAPVDYVASAFVALSLRGEAGSTFHVVHPESTSLARVAELVSECGYPLELLPFAEWLDRLLSWPRFEESRLFPFRWMLANIEDPEASTPEYRCDAALRTLGDDMRWPPIDAELVRKYLTAYEREGLIDRGRRS
ncbi:MAG TPA: amino acid adenylation domain-containing protein [Thermoleophilaceae bacterium]|nr:amino acid adenylation domain-containing protein [Thermoleophilaceae bacterium]